MKKLGAMIVSMAMVLTAILGNVATVRAAEAAPVELKALDQEGKAATATSLEIDDILTIAVVANTSLDDVASIEGDLVYDEERFVPYNTDITKDLENGWARGWNTDTNRIKIQADSTLMPNSDLETRRQTTSGTQVATIKLRVIKAVDSVAEVRFTNLTVNTTKEDEPSYECQEISLSVNNSQYGKRNLSLNVATEVTAPAERNVKIPISVTDNTGFSGLALKVTYDTSVLEYVDTTMSSKLMAYAECWYKTYDEDKGEVNIILVGSKDIKVTDCDLFYVEFTVHSDRVGQGVSSWDYIRAYSVEFIEGEGARGTNDGKGFHNSSYTTMNATINGVAAGPAYGTVTATPKVMTGDVNRDGYVNLVDASYLLQYYNGMVSGWDDIQLDVADVNNDKNINLTDVLLIMKYFNGEDVSSQWVEKSI